MGADPRKIQKPQKIINSAESFLIIGIILAMISFLLWAYTFFKYFKS